MTQPYTARHTWVVGTEKHHAAVVHVLPRHVCCIPDHRVDWRAACSSAMGLKGGAANIQQLGRLAGPGSKAANRPPARPPASLPIGGRCGSFADSSRAARLACQRFQLSAAGDWPLSAAACRAARSAGAATACQSHVGSGEPAASVSRAARICTQTWRVARYTVGNLFCTLPNVASKTNMQGTKEHGGATRSLLCASAPQSRTWPSWSAGMLASMG